MRCRAGRGKKCSLKKKKGRRDRLLRRPSGENGFGLLFGFFGADAGPTSAGSGGDAGAAFGAHGAALAATSGGRGGFLAGAGRTAAARGDTAAAENGGEFAIQPVDLLFNIGGAPKLSPTYIR